MHLQAGEMAQFTAAVSAPPEDWGLPPSTPTRLTITCNSNLKNTVPSSSLPGAQACADIHEGKTLIHIKHKLQVIHTHAYTQRHSAFSKEDGAKSPGSPIPG